MASKELFESHFVDIMSRMELKSSFFIKLNPKPFFPIIKKIKFGAKNAKLI